MTRSGNVLILVELGLGTESKTKFCDALPSTLGNYATIRCVESNAIVELRDLNKLTSVEEVSAAVDTAFQGNLEGEVFVSKANFWHQKMAMVTSNHRES